MRWLILSVITIGFSTLGLAATYTAASCQQFTNPAGTSGTFASPDPGSVMGTFATEQLTPVDGDVIAIPAGTCTWPGNPWRVSPTNSLTFQGAGALTPSTSCTFAPGSACTTTSGSDLTTITDGSSAGQAMVIVTVAGNKTFRLTGVHYLFPMSNPNTNTSGGWTFAGGNGSSNVRIDHSHFDGYSQQWIGMNGWLFGVADHNLIDQRMGPAAFVNVYNGIGWNNENTNFGNGNGSWADTSSWGSNRAFFIENNVWPDDGSTSGVYIDDCSNGGRQVERYNTFESSKNVIQTHEGGGNNRGCRTTEVYGNTHTSTGNGTLVGGISGSALVWGNVGAWQQMYGPNVARASTVYSNFNPNNVGTCGQATSGTATSSGSTVTWVSSLVQPGGIAYQFYTSWPDESTPNMVFNGTSYPIASCSSVTSCTLTGLTGSNATAVAWYAPSVWDGNTDSSGYPCMDQPGRGQGDLLTGSFATQTRINSALGTASWPRQALDPSYVWNNTNSLSGGICWATFSYSSAMLVANRDVYQSFGTGCETGTFDGTRGIGQGLNSAKPATCTAGPGGNTPGVGFWATDQNTLYVCNPTNTWVSYYTPYTYPHPLNTSSPSSILFSQTLLPLLGVGGPNSSAAPTFVSSCTNVVSGAPSAITCVLSSAPTAGSVIVGNLTANGGTISTVCDGTGTGGCTGSSTYTINPQFTNSGSGLYTNTFFTCNSAGGATITITMNTTAGTLYTTGVSAIGNATTGTTCRDGYAQAQSITPGTAFQSPAITTTHFDLMVGIFGFSCTTITAGGDGAGHTYTLRATNSFNAIQTLGQTTIGSFYSAATGSGAGSPCPWNAELYAIRGP